MLNLESLKKEFSPSNISQRMIGFFARVIKKFVFCLFCILAVYCGYVWYIYVYSPHWSLEKETEYLKNKNEEITFDQKKFQVIMEREQERSKEYAKKVEIKKDIFGIE